MTQVPMIDVSANNHGDDQPIRWSSVYAAKFKAVMVKASEGTTYLNPWLDQDAHAAHQAGLLVGYYHFAHPGENNPAAEVDHAMTAIADLPRELGLALDLEVQEGKAWSALAIWAKEFHHLARQHVDHSPLYVNDNFLANLPGAPWGERLWLAQTARPRRQVWAWQATTPVQVPGIPYPTDVGYLHPDE